MKPNRGILALVTDAFGAGGGIAQYNRDLITALATGDSGAEIDASPRQASKSVPSLPRNVFQFNSIQAQVPYSLRALDLAARNRPDVIFCGHLYMAPLALIVARLCRAKLVIQTHGVEVWPKPTALQRAAVEAADLVLCVSRDTRARVQSRAAIAPERVVVLPNTVSEVYSPGDGSAMRAKMGLQGKTVLLSVSRLDAGQRYKGQDRVIPLIRNLRARGHNVVFLIGGKGTDRARLEALAHDNGVADHVRFLGEVPNEALVDLYRAADLYLMPSSGEGFGIVFLEAMACGLPALGLAIGGAIDALTDGIATDEADLEAAILRFLEAPRPTADELAAAVRARFGRPIFHQRAAQVFSRPMANEHALAA